MKKILKLEELAEFLFTIVLFAQLDFSWWWYPLLIFTPDFSMVGYLFGTRSGAITYNFFHHKGTAIIIGAIGYMTGNPVVILTGLILFGHAALDRSLGYGLKHTDSFHHTHLGHIGK